jgi:ubiquitin-protein ligase
MNGILERRFQRFEQENNSNLKEYFGIIDTPQRIVNINATHNNDAVICTVSFKEVNKMINIRCLPMDIICKISSYLNCYLTIKTKIIYPQDYPFEPPQWSLVCVKHNIESRMNLKEYYEYLVETHNNKYTIDWSPAIHIDIDILDFISKINHFDYLIECR